MMTLGVSLEVTSRPLRHPDSGQTSSRIQILRLDVAKQASLGLEDLLLVFGLEQLREEYLDICLGGESNSTVHLTTNMRLKKFLAVLTPVPRMNMEAVLARAKFVTIIRHPAPLAVGILVS